MSAMDTHASYRTLASRSTGTFDKRQGTNVTQQGHATELILDKGNQERFLMYINILDPTKPTIPLNPPLPRRGGHPCLFLLWRHWSELSKDAL